MIAAFEAMPLLAAGILASLIAGLGTTVGALPVLAGRGLSERNQALVLAAAGGIMLGATVFSLMVPALEMSTEASGSELRASLEVSAAVLLGALVIWLIHARVPHEHFVKGREGTPFIDLGRNWLFIIAITLHNFPEGMSVGTAFGAGAGSGVAVMIGIGLQNMPEGLAVAAALRSEGASPWRAFAIATLTGLVEPVGDVVGAAAASLSDVVLPWALAFAAGAMLFVISGEVIPETHRGGREHRATISLVIGFLVMMILDVTLG